MESAEPTGAPASFEVVVEHLLVRAAPSTSAKPSGAANRGERLFGTPYKIDGEPWLKLHHSASREEWELRANCGWVLIHGSCVGLGQLLRHLPEAGTVLESSPAPCTGTPGPAAIAAGRAKESLPEVAARPEPFQAEQAEADETPAAGLFEVVHEHIIVRLAPSTSSKPFGAANRGELLFGTPITVGNDPWLRIEHGLACERMGEVATCGWALIHGARVGLGQLLRHRPELLPPLDCRVCTRHGASVRRPE